MTAPSPAPTEPQPPALTPVSASAPARVYLVATGVIHEGQETYTRHEASPPPMCDAELLWSAAPASAPEVDPMALKNYAAWASVFMAKSGHPPTAAEVFEQWQEAGQGQAVAEVREDKRSGKVFIASLGDADLEPGMKLYASPASAPSEPMEMRLCETEFVHLRPDQPYVFTVDAGCPRCVEMAAIYLPGDDPASAPSVQTVRMTDDAIKEWGERHDLGISSMTDLREVFEDAQSLHMTIGAPVADSAKE